MTNLSLSTFRRCWITTGLLPCLLVLQANKYFVENSSFCDTDLPFSFPVFILIPSFLHLNAKLFAHLPVHVCSCLVLAMGVFSFSQFREARDQLVDGLIETATQSAFWVHIGFFEDIVLVPACWEALILGCEDKTLGFCLEASCF